jgi:hypothetical protein
MQVRYRSTFAPSLRMALLAYPLLGPAVHGAFTLTHSGGNLLAGY